MNEYILRTPYCSYEGQYLLSIYHHVIIVAAFWHYKHVVTLITILSDLSASEHAFIQL